MLEPYRGRVYDPCCGSSGMFTQSAEFIRAHASGNGNGATPLEPTRLAKLAVLRLRWLYGGGERYPGGNRLRVRRVWGMTKLSARCLFSVRDGSGRVGFWAAVSADAGSFVS